MNTSTESGWEFFKELGQGGFGLVSLYFNRNTTEYIAIKKLRKRDDFGDRVWERWKMEVNIMRRLNHENVIKAVDIPPELNLDPGTALGMEFCQSGDLRKVLGRPENIYGLREVHIRDIVSGVGGAVEYLHNMRVIHRDIKPENIVLQPRPGCDRFFYKIIDLGYAKELDASSCCISHVGTPQYLAPELYGNKEYTRTVDYWSLGTVVFECITGRRPFLHDHQSNPQWHEHIKKKSPDDIYAVMKEDGAVQFSKSLPKQNFLCEPLQKYMEQWLTLMLRWDANYRGGGVKQITDSDVERPKCFVLTEKVLEMRLFHIFYGKANHLLCFPVNENHTVNKVCEAIQVKTNIPKNKQVLIDRSGIKLNPHSFAFKHCQDSTTENPSVFLYCEDFDTKDLEKKSKLPGPVEMIVKEPQTVLSAQHHKNAWKHAVYFCANENFDCKQLMKSEAAIKYAQVRTAGSLIKQKDSLVEELRKLHAFLEFFKTSLDFDLLQITEQRSSNVYHSETLMELYRQWQSSIQQIGNIEELNEQVKKLGIQADELAQTLSENGKPDDDTNVKKLEECERDSKQLYDQFIQTLRTGGQQTLEHKVMVDIVGKCVVNREKNTLHDNIKVIFQYLEEMRLAIIEVNRLTLSVQEKQGFLMSLHKQRQADLWRMINGTSSNPPMDSMHLTDQSMRSFAPLNGEASLSSVSPHLNSIQLVDDAKTSAQLMDDMLKAWSEDHDESFEFISAYRFQIPTEGERQ